MSNVIPFVYQDKKVSFDFDGWINATESAKCFGKESYDWLVSKDTVSYMVALAEAINAEVNPRFLQEINKIKELDGSKPSTKAKVLRLAKAVGLVRTKSGAPEFGGGTWLHPKLTVLFARWLDIRFAVWCDFQIDALLRGDLQVKENYSTAQQALLQAKQQASKSGAELASWRWSKGNLQHQVEYWGGQLSLMLQGQNDDYEGF